VWEVINNSQLLQEFASEAHGLKELIKEIVGGGLIHEFVQSHIVVHTVHVVGLQQRNLPK
jgi:hypothetical protein